MGDDSLDWESAGEKEGSFCRLEAMQSGASTFRLAAGMVGNIEVALGKSADTAIFGDL